MNKQFGFHEGDSFLHILNPLAKFLSLIFIMIGILIYPSLTLTIFFLLLTLIGFRVAQVPLELSHNRVRFLLVFSVLLLVLQVMVISNGNVIIYLVPVLNGTGPFFPITDYGISVGLVFATRFLLIVLSSMLFVSVTDPTLLAHSLARSGVPYRYSFALIISLRFLPLFDAESDMVRMAQRARGITYDVRSIHGILASIRYTFYPLLVSALSRVDTLSMSMDGRGFGYDTHRTYVRFAKWRKRDSFLMILSLGFLILCVLFSFNILPFPLILF
ncbi:MAG: conserved membrane protein of unknown function [Candidatus Thorarchaeota archaeon]|nr:MAG: conserved membrane protein of unknown function [Candidatus Thorarchaeota archaeon]